VISNLTAIEADLSKVKSDFSNNDFLSLGKDIADILILALGKVPAQSKIPLFFQ
jgi:hypothetical protein